MPSKATRSDHYLAIAEFDGHQLVEDIRNPTIPEFVIVRSARRTAHFAIEAVRLSERRQARRSTPATMTPWQALGRGTAAISSASRS